MKRRTFLASSAVAAVFGGSDAMGEDLQTSLERIQRWLAAEAPQILDALRPPATSPDLSALERHAGKLPQDLVALYQWHDGIDPEKVANLFFSFVFESATAVVNRMQRQAGPRAALKYADPGIDAGFSLGPTRIPIGNDSSHCFLCVDLAPTKEGSVGQVIVIDDEYSVGLKLHDSVSELVSSFARDLEQGKYTLAEDALEDGVQWLSPQRSIDPINWYNSPTWSRAHKFRRKV